MTRLSAFVVSLLLIGSGCAGDDGAAEAQTPAPTTAASTSSPPTPTETLTPTPSETPSETATQLPDEQAQRLFDDALRKLVDDDTGRIRTQARLGTGSIVTESRFRLSNKSLEARVDLGGDGEERVQISLVAIGQRAWVRVDNAPDGEAEQCWTGGDARDVAEANGYDLPRGTLGVPPAVAVLLSAEPQSGTTSRVTVAANLFVLASSILASTPRKLGIDATSDATAPVQVFVHDGELGGWTITVGNLFRAVQEAGGTIPEEVADHLDDPSLGTLLAQFYDPGEPVDLAPPPADQQCPAG